MANEITHALACLKARQDAYRLYEDYYDGNHRLAFATEKFRSTFGRLFSEFADNLCPSIVDALADRLELTGFSTETPAEGDAEDELGNAAWALWQANRMDVRAGQVHQDALRSGDGYVLVWPNASGAPTIYPQKPRLIHVEYDEEEPGKILWAVKCWPERVPGGSGEHERRKYRLNLYWPDRIDKFITKNTHDCLPEKADAFEALPGEPTVLNPWGVVPVFHFGNNADIGACGRSELKPAIPIQDALNKALMDMLVAMEFVALPQRWVAGMEIQIDPETNKPVLPVTFDPRRLWTFENENTKTGQFPGADLKQFLETQDSFRVEMARVTGTPLHYISLITDPPSGEALKTLEARFVKKARDRQAAFGNTWEDALLLALRMDKKAGGEARLSAGWTDPAPKSEKDQAETAEIKGRVGVTRRQNLLELGYTKKQVSDMEAEHAAEDEKKAQEQKDLLAMRGSNTQNAPM